MEATQTKNQTIHHQPVTRNLFSYFSLVNRSFAYPALDGLRAIAIILVLLRHAVNDFQEPTNAIAMVIWNICRNGWLGVDLFFVLSGFLITRSFYSLQSQHNNRLLVIKKFYISRTLRTWPLYFAIILLIVIGAFPYYEVDDNTFASELLQHILFLQDYFGTSILVPLWSLATEEKFYLLIPLVLVVFNDIKKQYLLLTLTAVVLISLTTRSITSNHPDLITYESFFWVARAPFHQALDGLLAGCLTYFFHQTFSIKQPNITYKILTIMLVIIGLGLLAYQDYLGNAEWLTASILISIASVVFASWVYLALYSKSSWLSCMPFRIISTLSYSLYLCHYALLPLCYRISGITDTSNTEFLSLVWLLFFICFICISLVASMILHYTIEKPFLLWKKNLKN